MGGEGKGGLMDSLDTILVPDLDAAAITALAKKQCKLTFLDADYEKWNYLVDLNGRTISGRGKRFEALVWRPDRAIFADDVCEYFQQRGFYGHAAAFTAWVAEHSPAGYHASILERNACWCSSDERRYVPISCFVGRGRGLDRGILDPQWDDDWCFVAFREL